MEGGEIVMDDLTARVLTEVTNESLDTVDNQDW